MTLDEIAAEFRAAAESLLTSYQGAAARILERERRIEEEIARIASSGMTEAELRRELAITRVDYLMTSERAQDLDKIGRAIARVVEQMAEKRSTDTRRGGEALKAANTFKGMTVEQRCDQVRAAWASGRYASKNACAEAEHEGLGLSLKVARNALIKL